MDALSGRAALVTGASSGIGRAIAVALAGAGAAVGFVGRDKARLDEAAAEAAGRHGASADRLFVFTADLEHEDEMTALVVRLHEVWGGVDVLVHSAGAYRRATTEEAALADLDVLYGANLRAPYRLTQLLLPALKARQGDIVFVNSTQGLTPSAGVGQFAATQHALKAIAEALRNEVNDAGVRVMTIHLGRTATPRQERIFAMEGRPYTPERLIQPEDVAFVVLAGLRLPRTAEITTLTVLPTRKA